MLNRRGFRALAFIAAAIVLLVQPSVPATSAPSGLTVRFQPQPKDGQVGQQVTSEAFNPAATPPGIAIYDGNKLANIKTPVTISLVSSTSGTVSSFTVQTDKGVASLPGIVVSTPGQAYTLFANATELATTATSNSFDVYEVVSDCSTGPCKASIARAGQMSVDVQANTASGHLALNVAPLPTAGSACLTTSDHHAPLLTIQDEAGIAVSKTATLVIDKAYVTTWTENGTSFYNVCFSKDGVTYSTLPDCPVKKPSEPCVLSRTKQNGDVIVKIFLPAGDPFWF